MPDESLPRRGGAENATREKGRRRVPARRDKEALRESEERTRLILDNALDAVITIDMEGRIISWNPQAERVFGWPAAEVIGRRLSQTIVPHAYRDAHEQGLRRFRETGEGPALNRRMELTAMRRDGTEFPVELAITPVRLKGSIVFSAFLRDLTEHKHAEEERRKSEASFRILFASNPLPMWVYDVATLAFLEVNDAAVAQYGYSRAEFLGMRITDIRPPEEVDRLKEMVARWAPASGGSVRRHAGPWRHRLKDGRIRDVGVASHLIEFDGRPAALVVALDVTDFKQAEAARSTYAERLELLHEIDAAIIAAEAPAAIAEAALRRLRPLLGAPRAVVTVFDLAAGEGEWLAVDTDVRTTVGPGIRFPLELMGDLAALQRGEAQVIEDVAALAHIPAARGLLAEGIRSFLVMPLVVRGTLIGSLNFGADRPGRFPAEQVGIAREVATQLAIALEQARLHERLQRQTEELEERVRERTRELSVANEQLGYEIDERRRAEADADRANRAKSDFLSRMSHELRTPLNGILGFAQLLELELQTPDQRESVAHILKGGRHLLALINEILDIARIEAGRLAISLEPVIASDVVRSALDLVRPQAAARRVSVPDELVCEHWVIADRQRLQQVLLNLLSNAVKYNRDGGSVAVTCADVPPDGVQLAIRDTGRGIPPEMLERVFTPFERLGAEETGVEGTGLGLALSKRLVEAMGGQLTVDSQIGEGSTFTVELPRGEPRTLSASLTEDAAPAHGQPGIRGTILYIEDNLANLRLLERIMTRRPGVVLLSAMQGTRGLELARDHRPDVIVLDLHLPDVPGIEVLARLRDDPATTAIPVVVLSADATPSQITRLRAHGAHAYLTKPLDVKEFLALLDRMLDGKRG